MTLPDDAQQSSRYRPIAEIGRGGMGEVFLAVAHGVAGFTKLVVLKRSRPDLTDEPQVLAMFLDEARLAARLNHPNVVQTYEAGLESGSYFIAMEYLDGQPLHRIRARVGPRGFPLSMQIRILIEALAGLHYAHELTDFDGTSLGVVHRDATPQNIFVTYDGQIKVVDFGIAKAASSTIKTRAGMIKGKVSYLAPEQTRSEPLDRRVDIFTVGVMLWEAIAGERMWKGVPNTEIIKRLAAGKLPTLPADAPYNDPELVQICYRALAQPAERYANAVELQHELERWLARQGEEVTGRVVGTFVAAHFQEERASIKALLEDELRDYSSSSRPRVSKSDQPLQDFDLTVASSKAPSRLPLLESAPAPPAAQAATAVEASPPAAPATPAGESHPLTITVTMRSSLPDVIPEDCLPPAPVSTRSPISEPASKSALDKGGSPSPLQLQGHETLGRSSVSLDTVTDSRSASRSQRWRWRSMAIGSAVLISGAAAVLVLTLGRPLPWSDGIASLRPGSTASVNSLPSGDPAPAANSAASVNQVNLTVRVSPASARIFFDGTLVGTGSYKDKLSKDDQVHVIRVEAPNFVTIEESITASSDQIVTLALERKAAKE
jgi:eukaryotic-like serine/threonine-protein kinase